jgi:hypothetical protein
MKTIKLGLAVASFSIALAACATHGRPFIGAGVQPVGYDAYYDDAYGPFYDGYWGDDGAFYYCPGSGQPFVRDGGGHFRHDGGGGGGGFHAVHGGGGGGGRR